MNNLNHYEEAKDALRHKMIEMAAEKHLHSEQLLLLLNELQTELLQNILHTKIM